MFYEIAQLVQEQMGGFITLPKQPVSLSVILSGACGLSLSLPHVFLFSHLFPPDFYFRERFYTSQPQEENNLSNIFLSFMWKDQTTDLTTNQDPMLNSERYVATEMSTNKAWF